MYWVLAPFAIGGLRAADPPARVRVAAGRRACSPSRSRPSSPTARNGSASPPSRRSSCSPPPRSCAIARRVASRGHRRPCPTRPRRHPAGSGHRLVGPDVRYRPVRRYAARPCSGWSGRWSRRSPADVDPRHRIAIEGYVDGVLRAMPELPAARRRGRVDRARQRRVDRPAARISSAASPTGSRGGSTAGSGRSASTSGCSRRS